MREREIVDMVNNNLVSIITGQTGNYFYFFLFKKDVVKVHKFLNFYMRLDILIKRAIILV